MKIKMLIQIAGARDGVAYPAPGETLDLPDNEAAKLCAAGFAEPIAERAKPEKAVARQAETRESKTPVPAKKAAKKAVAKKSAG